jgi:hypothetical protein
LWTVWTLILSAICALAAFVWRSNPWIARLVLWSAAWILISTLPTYGILSAAPDLQNSRYVYLPAAGWCIALAAHVAVSGATRWKACAPSAVAAFAIAVCALTARAHLEHWSHAALLRDAALAHVNALASTCTRITVTGVPDNYRGAYVFRNGLPEAFARAHPGSSVVTVAADGGEDGCRVDLSDLPQRNTSR